jgi:hypothetical protein
VNSAGVTGGAEPDGIGGKNFFFESGAGHGNNPAGRVIHVNGKGAGGRTHPALNAVVQVFAALNCYDLLAEVRVKFFLVFNRSLKMFH